MSESDRQALRGKTAASLRAANLSLVLREIVAATTPPSRAALAAKLGMTRSTVSRLVDDLVAGRCVTEGDAQNVGRGRPAVPLYPAAGTLLALGIEINVGRTVVSVVDLGGNTVASRVVERESAELGPEATLGLVAREAADLLDELPVGARVVGAHLVVPGLVDRDGLTVLRAPNLHWDGAEPGALLRDFLEERRLPFRIGNDINAAAVTVVDEARATGETRPSFVYVTGEVGIGAAIMYAGTHLQGQHGFAGEIGHTCVDVEGPTCGCGARGCLETFVGLKAILRDSGAGTLDELRELLSDGDAEALRTMRLAGSVLGQAIGSALNVLDVPTVILGGFLGDLAEWVRPTLVEALAERVLWARYSEVDVRVAVRSTARAARGAALMALQRVIDDPAAWIDDPAPQRA